MVALVFPGQGSQRPGMAAEVVDASHEARDAFARIGLAAGVDLDALCRRSDEETLRRTANAQIALFAAGVAAWRALEARLREPVRLAVAAAAGHSVGEYAALAAAGVVSIEDGARLVRVRGEAMGRASEGGMIAILGMDRKELEATVAKVDGVVIANDNCPGQIVISGPTEGVRQAADLALAAGAKRAVPLNVGGAFHSPLMTEAAGEFASAVQATTFHPGGYRVYSNVTAEAVPDPEAWRELLPQQLRFPVRWTETVRNLLRDGVNTFVECGGGEVLCGLIRRIDRGARCLAVGDAASLEAAVESLNA